MSFENKLVALVNKEIENNDISRKMPWMWRRFSKN
jgi:hypothetical protein